MSFQTTNKKTMKNLNAFVLQRSFTSSSSVSQRPDHPLYLQLDWDQVRSGKYAIVDPLDPANILYLTHREYLVQSRVMISNDATCIVLATPRDTPLPNTNESDQNSPPRPKGRKHLRNLSRLFESDDRKSRFHRLQGAFKSALNKYLTKKVSVDDQITIGGRRTSKKEKLPSVIELSRETVEKLVLDWGNLLWFRIFGVKSSRGYSKCLRHFSHSLENLLTHQGSLTLVKRLKIELHCVLAYIAGTPMKSTQELGIRVRLRHGLPLTLSAEARRSIRSRDPQVWRLYISLLAMYKAMSSEYEPASLGAITAPPLDESKSALFEEFTQFVQTEAPKLFRDVWESGWDRSKLVPTSPYFSTKAGPNGPSFLSMRADVIVWMLKEAWKEGLFDGIPYDVKDPLVGFIDLWFLVCENHRKLLDRSPLGIYLNTVGDNDTLGAISEMILYSTFDIVEGGPDKIPEDVSRLFKIAWDYRDGKDKPVWAIRDGVNSPTLAKLVALYEPAGKIRNIVTVDYFTQHALKPLHHHLFRCLQCLPCDATMDQDGSLKSFMDKGYKNISSLDLSSATEWIPQSLYRVVFSAIFGEPVAQAWLALLTNRDITPVEDYGTSSWRTVRYTRGQPMGALSSWSAMAVTHHMVLLFAAKLAHRVNFEDYRILGDDVIIGDEGVAYCYERVARDLGIKIGLPKSFNSRIGFGNFAGQSFIGSVNLSPISILEEMMITSPAPRSEMAVRLLRRGFWDLDSAGWFTSLLRLMVSPAAYRQIVDARREGKIDPLVRAVYMAVLGFPQRFTSLVVSPGFSIFNYFGGLTVSMKLFSMPFLRFWNSYLAGDFIVKECVLSACLCKAKRLFALFLPLDRTLQDLNSIMNECQGMAPVHKSPLFKEERQYLRHVVLRYDTFEETLNKFLSWERTYLPMVQIVLQECANELSDLNRAEIAVGIPLQEVYAGLCQAEETLVLALDSLLGVEAPDLVTDPDASIRSLDRLLHSFEHFQEIATMPNYVLDPSWFPEDWLQDGLITVQPKSH